ncbi:MAG: polyphosphate kinase 1 [Chlorobi bacterium]|nr:polyphosphate kinase 1 [Chlorobiota bacterium]
MQRKKYINRDISWLSFNERVLQEASDPRVPLLERLRFVGIFSNNMDEFFKVRYAKIQRISQGKIPGRSRHEIREAKRLLKQINEIAIRQQEKMRQVRRKILEELKNHGIHIITEKELTPAQGEFVRNYFLEKVSPRLFTIILNDLPEFPIIKDSSVYLAVKMSKAGSENIYALVEIPSEELGRFVVLPREGDTHYIMLLEDVIRHNLDEIFNLFEYDDIEAHIIKISRDAQFDEDDDRTRSIMDKVSFYLRKRKEGEPVRLIYDESIAEDTLNFLKEKMGIDEYDSLIPGGRIHNHRDFMDFPDLGKKELLYKPMPPLPIAGFSLRGSILKQIAEKDRILYTPSHNYKYVIKFLREAALDPKVKSIKITIYRLARNSQIANSLINAAKNGKDVTVQIELRARFDEAQNIKYARMFRDEGIRVIYGFPDMKVHSKICVVEREEGDEIKRYGFISTGNFNEKTAKIYTDYTLFTANQELLEDTARVFDFFEINYRIPRYKHLWVSPHYLRKKINRKINEQIKRAKEGKPALIRMKMNSLSDKRMIDKLYEASRAGVPIRLIVRGINSLIPGIPGMSENIEAISIVDKYLEHPRVFIFGPEGEEEVYIGSADLMPRNLDRRVEVVAPVLDEDVKKEIIDVFEISWADNVKARIFNEAQDNQYRRTDGPPVRSQFEIYEYYKRKLEELPAALPSEPKK